MIKAKDIINIKKEHDRYKKLSENETDIVKKMKYGRIFRDYDYKVLQIELQLTNIELGLYRDIDLERLVDKYRLSRSSIYKTCNKVKSLFESNRLRI